MAIERGKIRWNGWGWAVHKDALADRDEVWTWLAHELGMPSLLATPARPLGEISLPLSRLSTAARTRFESLLGSGQVRDDKYERAFHALGRSYHDLLRLRAGDLARAPDAVLYPRMGEDVLAVLAEASESGIAVVPYGGGTSVVGGVSAEPRSFKAVVTLDLTEMDGVLSIDSGSATAEAGIYGTALEEALQARGVTLGHCPQSFEFSTLGGWIAHRGAGQLSHRYGKAEDWLLSARVATPRGWLEPEAFPASAAGPRLADLFAGSEGVFGVITEATFRVHALPGKSEYCGFLFHDFAAGLAAIRQAAQEEIPIAMLRLSDAEETRFQRAFSELGKRRGVMQRFTERYLAARGFGADAAVLIAGFEGDVKTVAASHHRFSAVSRKLGAMSLGRNVGERWRASRFQAPYLRDSLLDRGVGVDTFETAAHWAQLDALHAAVRAALHDVVRTTAPRPEARGVVMCHVSHSYPDGASLYFTCVFPRALDNEIAQWRAIKNAASEAIVAHGGTISHHHGVGEDHLPWMEREKGALGLDILRAIKRAVDPRGILNPGKLIPP